MIQETFDIERIIKTNKLKKIIYNNKTYCIINQCLVIFLHIFLLSLFEPYFYFMYITKLEKQAMYDLIDSYINKLNNYYLLLDNNVKLQIKNNYNIFSNITDLLYMSNEDIISINNKKNILIHKSIYISIQIFCILFIFSLLGIVIRKHISIKYIILENIIMISLLAYYEYTFFNKIILEYDPISKSEINNYIISEIQQIII
tara:strand:- start:1878 stop:2483 length:606 start_codon:yes stop_codon:yes gene_type:complete